MDTPNRQFWLSNFPLDIWYYIAYYLPGEQLGRLKMTGAKSLWDMLIQMRVVKSVKLGLDHLQFESPPAFLNEFPSLEELMVDAVSKKWRDALSLTVDRTPATLRKIRFAGWQSIHRFTAGQSLGKYLPNIVEIDLSQIYVDQLPETDQRDLSWLATPPTPQHLLKLCIYGWDGVTKLPSSLTYLAFRFLSLTGNMTELELPPNLETLHTGKLTGFDTLVPLLPPSLKNLTFDTTDLYSGSSPFDRFPRSLNSLKIINMPSLDFETSPEILLSLPPSLVELSVCNHHVPTSSWSLLPPLLTKFACRTWEHSPNVVGSILYMSRQNHQFEPEFITTLALPFETLPRSLTHFDFGYVRDSNDAVLSGPPPQSSFTSKSYFPPYLTFLDISSVHISPEAVKHLPPSLLDLRLYNFCSSVCENLPKSVTQLSACCTYLTPALVKFLPQYLISLRMGFKPCYHGVWEKLSAPDQLRDDGSEGSVDDTILDWTDSKLPPKLTQLHVHSFHDLGDSFIQILRLPTLLKLQIPYFFTLTDQAVSLFSPSLVSINLNSVTRITGQSFKLFPRSLTSLYINAASSVFDPDIQHLPRVLKLVEMDSAIHLTDLCIPDLPPHLEYLNLEKNRKITPDCFPRLPYTLRSSQNFYAIRLATWKAQCGEIKLSAN